MMNSPLLNFVFPNDIGFTERTTVMVFLNSNEKPFSALKLQLSLSCLFNAHNEIHSFFQCQPAYFSGNQEATTSLHQ